MMTTHTIFALSLIAIFLAFVGLLIVYLLTPPRKVRINHTNKRFYIEIYRRFFWNRCENMQELIEFYKPDKPMRYPFMNKKQAIYVMENIRRTIEETRILKKTKKMKKHNN